MQQRSIFQHNTVLSASIVVESYFVLLGHGEDSTSVTRLTDSHSQSSILCMTLCSTVTATALQAAILTTLSQRLNLIK